MQVLTQRFVQRQSIGKALLAGAAALLLAATPSAFADGSKGGLEGGGTVKGSVVWAEEAIPRQKAPVDMSADAFCKDAHDEPVYPNNYVISDDRKIANTLVFIRAGIDAKKYKAPSEVAVLDQVGCRYTPHILAVTVGQTVEIRNSDNTMHNVHATPRKNDEFNKATGPGAKIEHVFEEVEPGVPFKCDVHPWMGAFVHVLPHPFFAVTNEEGEFEISGLPDGKYAVAVMHEFGRMKPKKAVIEIEVKDGATDAITFEYGRK